MDVQVAVFLLVFLGISSLATVGICYMEMLQCRQNRKSKRGSCCRSDQINNSDLMCILGEADDPELATSLEIEPVPVDDTTMGNEVANYHILWGHNLYPKNILLFLANNFFDPQGPGQVYKFHIWRTSIRMYRLGQLLAGPCGSLNSLDLLYFDLMTEDVQVLLPRHIK